MKKVLALHQIVLSDSGSFLGGAIGALAGLSIGTVTGSVHAILAKVLAGSIWEPVHKNYKFNDKGRKIIGYKTYLSGNGIANVERKGNSELEIEMEATQGNFKLKLIVQVEYVIKRPGGYKYTKTLPECREIIFQKLREAVSKGEDFDTVLKTGFRAQRQSKNKCSIF